MNRVKMLCLTFCCLFFYFHGLSQEKIIIEGYVEDKNSGERLIQATIYDTQSKKWTVTNAYGHYNIVYLKKQKVELYCSYTGFYTDTVTLFPSNDTTINFKLSPSTQLNEVTVKANKPIHKRTEISTVEIETKQIENLPSLGGEVDIMKSFQLMPGVERGIEGSSNIYVRGGGHGQNLILLDDIPLYYVNHFGGLVSVFNSNALKKVKLIKGGFPAKYGDRLSSVMDIRMKDGNMKKLTGNLNIGLVSAGISLEGPIKKDTTSYMISLRRFMLDLLALKPAAYFLSEGKSTFGYGFYDINAKINHKISHKNRIYASFYLGDDYIKTKYTDKDDTEKVVSKNNTNWGNLLFSVRWNHLFSKKMFSNISLYYARFRHNQMVDFEMKEESEHLQIQDKKTTSIHDFGTRIDFDYTISSKYKLKFGMHSVFQRSQPMAASVRQTSNDEADIDSTAANRTYTSFKNALYIENHWDITPKFSTNAGLRFTQNLSSGKTYSAIEPRLIMRYEILKNTSLKTAFSYTTQNTHLLNYPSYFGPAIELWIPSTETIRPEKAWQVAFGGAHSLLDNKYEFSVETYYKEMSNLIAPQEGASAYTNASDWEKSLYSDGKGKSYGIEFLLQKKQGKFTGWVSYSFSQSKRQFAGLSEQKWFPFRYERPHSVTAVFSYNFNQKINFSATWQYTSGLPITLPHTKYYTMYLYDTQDEQLFYYFRRIYKYGKRNGDRMIAYHRLDLSARFSKKKKRGIRTWNISIYNVYNRLNAYYYFFSIVPDGNGNFSTKLKLMSLFPIIPSVSYSFRF